MRFTKHQVIVEAKKRVCPCLDLLNIAMRQPSLQDAVNYIIADTLYVQGKSVKNMMKQALQRK